MTILGTHKKKFVFVAKGCVQPSKMAVVALKIIKAAGMTPARPGRVDSYPFEGGGGNGYTLYQPLQESYLIADVYYDLTETEILISTCKPERMDTEAVVQVMSENIGPTEIDK